MAARVAISTAGQNGQYVGTTRVPTPTAAPGSTTCRNFNGSSDRLLLGPSNSLGLTYLALLTFWRADGSVLVDNATAQRLFTQYCVGGTRVGVGINRSFLSLTYTSAAGTTYTVESKVKVLDTARHFLGIEVTSSFIRIFLDGRVALKVTTSLAAPDLARVCIGADTSARFFKGQIDDVAAIPAYQSKVQNWLRYYREVVRGNFSRDYTAATFAAGYNSVSLSDDNYTASGFSTAPTSRVPLSQALRTEAELPKQFVEFSFSAGSGEIRLGVFNTSHDLSAADIGTTVNSYAFTQDSKLLRDNQVINSGFGTWSAANIMALGWDATLGQLSLWKDGVHLVDLNLPAGTWTIAVSLGGATAYMNAGQGVPLSLAVDTPGLPAKVWSKLTTEFRQMKLAEVCAPLDDTGTSLTDAYTGAAVGVYTTPSALEAGITPDSFDVSRRVGGGIKVNFGAHTTADDDFFFAIAFSPETADLTGEKVLLESPTKWGLRLIDGKLNAWVGSVQVGSSNVPFEAGKHYLLALTRSGTGKLLVWTHIGYILQSGDVTTTQASTDVWVGSGSAGDRAFSGRLSHLVLSSARPAAWKLNRLKSVYSWDVPNVAGMIPNPSDTRQVFELSWRDVIAAGISTSPTATSCYVGTVAHEPDSIAIEYRPVDRKGATAFSGANIASWAPVGSLLQYTSFDTDQLLLADAAHLETVTLGTALLVGSEICKVTAINTATLIVTVERGCADTIPAEHGAGTKVWFYDGHLGASRNAYALLDTVDVKMLSRSELAEMGEEFAPTDTVAMQGRLNRPYPPANVRINEQYAPTELTGTVYIQWDHRNKVSQGSALTGWFTPGSFAAPTDATYLVRAYNADTNELLHTSSVLTSIDKDYNLYVDEFDGNLKVVVVSVQGGQECLQAPALTFAYQHYSQAYLTTEEEEALETEPQDANIYAERITNLLAGSFSGQMPDDWAGFEEEEEEEEVTGATAGTHLYGLKFSDFGKKPTAFDGEEIIPFAINGTNYNMTFSEFLAWIVANAPQAADGKNAYEMWLEAGNTGSLNDFFEYYRGYRGLNSNSARRIQTINGATGAIICNWANYDEIRLRLVGDVTLTFQGAVDGQGCLLKFTQDTTGGRAITLPSSIRYNALVQHYTPTPTGGATDKVGFIYDSADGTYDFVTFVPGFST